MRSTFLIRGSIALVWLYQGLWCKLLAREPRHQAVAGAVPFLMESQSHAALMSLGAAEVVLAIWVISGSLAIEAAIAQTCLLLLMNGGGVIWARRIIPDPAGMLIQNLAFVTLVWVAAGTL